MNTPEFWTSRSICDPRAELLHIASVLDGEDEQARRDVFCRFPARVHFLQRELSLTGTHLPTPTCAELANYKQRAPADAISLIFAAENITHPMSMMGHVFLRFEGLDHEHKARDHAASFFTTIPSANIPGLLADSFFLGMPSRFVLLPYREQIAIYREQQGRNVWEYRLALTDYQRMLIHLHIWELRFINADYLFVGYNCATVIYLTLSLAAPNLLKDLGRWVAPIDVVRAAYAHHLVSERAFRPSLTWLVRAYEAQIGRARSSEIVETLGRHNNGGAFSELNLSPLELGFLDALSEKERISPKMFGINAPRIVEQIDAHTSSVPTRSTNVENVKDPITNPPLSRITVGYTWMEDTPSVRIEYRPASHSLSDDHKNGMTESALELGLAAVRIPSLEERPILETLHLYRFESLVPRSPIAGGDSTSISIGIEEQRDSQLSSFTAASLRGGIGRTYDLNIDAKVFALANLGTGYGDGQLYFTYGPELGAILYEVFEMKTIARYQLRCGEHSARSCYSQFSIEHALNGDKIIRPYGRVDERWNHHHRDTRVEIGFRFFF